MAVVPPFPIPPRALWPAELLEIPWKSLEPTLVRAVGRGERGVVRRDGGHKERSTAGSTAQEQRSFGRGGRGYLGGRMRRRRRPERDRGQQEKPQEEEQKQVQEARIVACLVHPVLVVIMSRDTYCSFRSKQTTSKFLESSRTQRPHSRPL